MKYSTKVRRFCFNTNFSHPLLHSVWETVARTRTTLNIFPNLQVLIWEPDEDEPNLFNLGIIFMHANIRKFSFSIPINVLTQWPYYFFEEISSRMPHLTNIDIGTSIPIRAIETEMISLISQLRKLQRITLPRHYLTTKFTEALSRLPNLVSILLARDFVGNPMDVRSFAPTLTDDAFPALLNISMTTTFHGTARFLKHKFPFTNLTELSVASAINENPSSIHSLISVVSENCQFLTDISLVSYLGETSVPEGINQSLNHITIEVLKPLLKLSKLVNVEITHRHPLALSQKDIELIASSWPSLNSLHLNPHPVHHTQSNLTLKALVPFAKHCPKLEFLGLFVDASSENELFRQVDLVSFQDLRLLDISTSIIDKTAHVAVCLSGILPLNCGLSIFGNDNGPDVAIRKRQIAWTKVQDLLPTLRTARMHERERTRYLLLEKVSKLNNRRRFCWQA